MWKELCCNSRMRLRFGIALAAAVALGAAVPLASFGQSAPNISADQIQQMLGGAGNSSVTTRPQLPQQTILEPVGPRVRELPTSRLEQILSQRAGAELHQFGYDQLGVGRAVVLPQAGALQDNYIVGPGDEIVVALRGQENNEYRVVVNRDGQIVLPRLTPIPASGRRLGDIRDDVSSSVRRAYVATEAFVSIGQLRQISVYVTGEVNSPGVRVMTGLSSVVDAILVSGGIKKTGSLRNLSIERAGRSVPVDLYGVLTQRASTRDMTLADGDRIIVPPLGRTAAVVGWVRRPGIYELAPGQNGISVAALLSLAGGFEVRGKYRLSVLRLQRDGRMSMVSLSRNAGFVRDSEILFASPGAQQTVNQAVLSGGTALAGQYSLGHATRLSDILRAPGALGTSPYTLFGLIVRKDPTTLLRTPVPFTPVSVINGRSDMDLQSDDTVRLFSVNESRLLFAVVTAFQERRAAAEVAARAPRAAEDVEASQQQYAAQVQAGGGTAVPYPVQTPNVLAANPSAAAQSQIPNQVPPRRNRPNTEREDIGELSTMILGDSGLVPMRRDFARTGTAESAQFPEPTFPPAYQAQAPVSSFAAQGYDQRGETQPGYEDSSPAFQPPYGEQAYLPRDQRAPETELPGNMERQAVGFGQVATNQEVRTFGDLAKQLGMDPLVLVRFLMDHEVTINGAVRGPGLYLVGPGVSLDELVAAAGGAAQWADRSSVQLISTEVDTTIGRAVTQQVALPLHGAVLANYTVQPHDDLRLNEVFNNAGIGSVTVQGEVRHTGIYQLVRGEHLSELLQQAGGLTDVAYPYGAVFLRRSAAMIEREGYQRAAREIENSLLLATTRRDPTTRVAADAFSSMQGFVAELRNQPALGRMTITADPAVLAVKPQLDVLLEPGDVLYIPQRPSAVSVLGEVMQPGSYAFVPDATPEQYVDRAGGYSQFADDDLTFVILPDGTANKVERSWLNFNGRKLPPGSAIVVPRDVSPLDFTLLITQVTQVLSQLAVTAASLAVVSQNN